MSNSRFECVPMGDRYGNLTVLGFSHKTKNNQYYYKCKCDCGKEIVVRKTLLTTGKQLSCGCATRRVKRKENKYIIDGQYVKIFMGNGSVALIDVEDLEKVTQHYWNIGGGSRYVFSYTAKMPLHRFVYGKNVMLDHINGDTMDNRKSNLRECTFSQNAINRKIRADNKTGVPGVQERNGKFIATVGINGKCQHKVFKTKEKAIEQRKAWERQFFGEWVRDSYAEVFVKD